FLPVSSSGHLEIGKAILQIEAKENLTFSIVVHGATVLSILVVFWRDIRTLLLRSFRFEYNESNSYVLKLMVSMVPVGIVGIFFKDQVESFFTGNIILVGSMLLVTAAILAITNFVPSGKRNITYLDALIIGIAQALAVMPGISRSGATISTAMFLGNKRDEAARFSFLMVILPIVAANFLDLRDMEASGSGSVGWFPLAVGFVAAFVSGLIACRWMLKIVRKGKLLYFGIYCLAVGIIAVAVGLI
ncbi:MAG: undecaprenyl-diphosphate phosphatase, partial [Bacteroidales bacterium]|nr:undecaprenyl-diphosphate phosphatase [Bacteroidales bacterium]